MTRIREKAGQKVRHTPQASAEHFGGTRKPLRPQPPTFPQKAMEVEKIAEPDLTHVAQIAQLPATQQVEQSGEFLGRIFNMRPDKIAFIKHQAKHALSALLPEEGRRLNDIMHEAMKKHPRIKGIIAAGVTVPLLFELIWTVFYNGYPVPGTNDRMSLEEAAWYGAVKVGQVLVPLETSPAEWHETWKAHEEGNQAKFNAGMHEVLDKGIKLWEDIAFGSIATTVVVTGSRILLDTRERSVKEAEEGKKRFKKPSAKIIYFAGTDNDPVLQSLVTNDEALIYPIATDESVLKKMKGLNRNGTYFVNLELNPTQHYDESTNWGLVNLTESNAVGPSNKHLLFVASGTKQEGFLLTNGSSESRAVGMRNFREGVRQIMTTHPNTIPVPILIGRKNTPAVNPYSRSRIATLETDGKEGHPRVWIIDPLEELAKHLKDRLNHNNTENSPVRFSIISYNPQFDDKFGYELQSLMSLENQRKFEYVADPFHSFSNDNIIVIENGGASAAGTYAMVANRLHVEGKQGKVVHVVANDNPIPLGKDLHGEKSKVSLRRAKHEIHLHSAQDPDRRATTTVVADLVMDKLEIIRRKIHEGIPLGQIKELH